MKTEPHKSIVTARVDYRYGKDDAAEALESRFADLKLKVSAVSLRAMLEKVLPHCGPTESAYFSWNLAEINEESQSWGVLWYEDGEARFETGVAICQADDMAFHDNVRFQCAVELVDKYQGLIHRALALEQAATRKAEIKSFADVASAN